MSLLYGIIIQGSIVSPPEGDPGSFAGLIDKIPYLVELGVTTIELMPVFQYGP